MENLGVMDELFASNDGACGEFVCGLIKPPVGPEGVREWREVARVSLEGEDMGGDLSALRNESVEREEGKRGINVDTSGDLL